MNCIDHWETDTGLAHNSQRYTKIELIGKNCQVSISTLDLVAVGYIHIGLAVMQDRYSPIGGPQKTCAM